MMRRHVLFLGAAAAASAGLGGLALVVTRQPAPQPLGVERLDLAPLDQVPPETWARLRARRIFFGHQSVGRDVVAGIEWILERRPDIGLRVAASSESDAWSSPGLVHGPIGANGDPESKMRDFEAVVRGANGAALDIALMKFCYVDFSSHGDVDALVARYHAMTQSVARERPALRLVHTTMPLTSLHIGRKARLKRLAGRAAPDEIDNAARGAYNEKLRAGFARAQLFDIAAVEAQAPGATPVVLERGGRQWATLAPELTTDGGHLNPGGQVLAAMELLITLARQA